MARKYQWVTLLFTSMFVTSVSSATSKCVQEKIQQQNCPECQISTASDPMLNGLPDELAHLNVDVPEGIVTDFHAGKASTSTLMLAPFRAAASVAPLTIDIDPTERHQTIWGYGAALTDACVADLQLLSPAQQAQLMLKIFDPNKGAGFNYIRVPVGSNDFALSDYTFDDTPGNQPDPDLKHFDFSHEAQTIAILRQAMQINPDVRFMASPWSAPAWMKSTGKLDGGTLLPQYYEAYSAYLVKTLEGFQRAGIPIDTLSVLNEPLIGTAATHWGFPQMYISQQEMEKLISGYLAPLMQQEQSAGRLKTKLLLHDHNWNNAKYIGTLLDDKTIAAETAGVAFHCYRGTPNDMYAAMASHPDVPMFNTECTAMLSSGEKSGDFQWWLQNESLDVTRHGVVGSMGWNLCLDDKGGPSNPGGCVGCRGMLTIHKDRSVTFNEEFNALAQVSRYVRRGAVRIGSTDLSQNGIANAAFQNADGSIALVMRNERSFPITLTVREEDCRTTTVTLPASGAVSLIWNQKHS